ncbi:MAG TPA: chemotaxis protein CheW, partial [Bacillales bacterium]|nr:chemotaxis protein CheW [Bacillales bacterium]
MMDFRGRMAPLIFLRETFSIPETPSVGDSFPVVIIRKGEKIAGLAVDALMGHQEIVLKSLGNYLTDVFGISGATILGDGKIALIIDCNTLIQ